MIYLQLIWAFIQVGLFSIGGGYAAMPLIEHQAVEVHSWLSMEEFADIMTISEMTPGPITINSATFVGMKTGGICGALAATLGCIIPSSVIVTLLAFVYYRYKGLKAVDSILKSLRPAVVAMIATACISLGNMALFNGEGLEGNLNCLNLAIMAVALIVLRLFRPSPILIIASAGVLGLLSPLI